MRFKKPIVSTGVYTIPGDIPRKVKIDQTRLDHWKAQFDKMKDEVMGGLKSLGNMFLGNFGMSVDNFKMN